jgi:WD40 repeat protein
MKAKYVMEVVVMCKTAGIAGSGVLKGLVTEALAHSTFASNRAGGMTWDCVVAAGLGEESPRTRPRVGYVIEVDAMTMECGKVVQAVKPVLCMAEVGEWVVSGHAGGSMRVWDRGTWECVKTVENAHEDSHIRAMTVWDGKVVTGGDDDKVKVWEAGTWTCRHVLEGHTSVVMDVEVLEESTMLSCSDDTTIRVWDTTTWTCRRVVDSGHTRAAYCLAVHAGMVYCGGWDTDGSGTVRVFEPSTWECVDVLRGHTSSVWRLLVWQDKLITASIDSTIKVWSTGATPRQCEHTLQGHTDDVNSLAVCGDKLVSCSDDKSIRVWSTETWACERVLQEGHHTNAVKALLCARDEESLISGSLDRTMRVWRDPTRGA